MSKTRFEKEISESFVKSDESFGKTLSPQEVMELFFPRKTAEFSDDLNLQQNRRNAIIPVGPYCSGKTTFAKKFLEEHKDFVLVSLDKCAVEEMNDFDEFELFTMSDRTSRELGNRSFGEMIAAGYKNIVVDGNWMDVNSRGALLKTLDYYNYHTIIYLIMPDLEDYKGRVKSRVYDILCSRELGLDLQSVLERDDLVQTYADTCGYTVEEAKNELEASDEFQEIFESEWNSALSELFNSNFIAQLQGTIIFFGADELIKL